MLPRPATIRWSSSAALTGARRPAKAVRPDWRRRSRCRAVPGRDRAAAGARRASSVGQRSITPKRRASLKVTRAPSVDLEHHMVVRLRRRLRVVERPQTCRPETSIRPDMPRCTISVSPPVEIGEQVLRPPPERRHPGAGQPLAPDRPGRASAGRGGGPRRARCAALQDAAARPRRTVSTSGSSGIRPPRRGAVAATPRTWPYKQRGRANRPEQPTGTRMSRRDAAPISASRPCPRPRRPARVHGVFARWPRATT